MEYTQSGHYERFETDVYGCENTYVLTLDMEFTPDFELVGTLWPIGGSETHISVNEYAIRLLEPRTQVDTVLWQIDCPNWYVMPHGDKGKECTLYIFSYLQEPITLHATTINRCDTIHQEFLIQTSYFGLGEDAQDVGFVIVPNPTTGNVTLRFGDLQGIGEVQVINSMGKNVDAFFVDMNTCHELPYVMPEVPDGLYCFVLNHNGTRIARKVMLVR